MSDQRRFKQRSGRLASTPINDGWAIDLDSRDPSIPNLPLQNPVIEGTATPGVGFVQVVSLTAYVVEAIDDNRPRVTIQGRIPTVVDQSVGGPVEATTLPGVGLITMEGRQSALQTETTLTPGVGLVIAQGLAPAMGSERVLVPDVGLATIGGLSGNALGEGQYAPTSGLLVIQGLAPTLVTETVVLPEAGLAIIQGLIPTVDTGGVVTVEATAEPGVGLVTLEGLVPVALSTVDPISRTYPGEGRKRRRGRSTPIPEYSADSAVAVPYAPPAQPLPGEPIPLRVGLGALAGVDLRRVVVPVKPEPAIDDNREAIRKRRRREEDLILQMILAA